MDDFYLFCIIKVSIYKSGLNSYRTTFIYSDLVSPTLLFIVFFLSQIFFHVYNLSIIMVNININKILKVVICVIDIDDNS